MKVVIFTNESYIKITELTLPYLVANSKGMGFEYFVVSNKLPDGFNKIKNVTYFDANEPFSSSSSHFSSTMSKFLSSIPDDERFFFLCDDYLFLSPIKSQRFSEIVNISIEQDLDVVSFGSQKHMDAFINEWECVNIDPSKYLLPPKSLRIMDNNYRHIFSVQPCLWKSGSFKEILKYNPELSIAYLDNANVKDKSGKYRGVMPGNFMFYSDINPETDYNFKCATTHYPPLSFNFDERIIGSDYFIMEYAEIIRWGKFINQGTNGERILHEILNMDINKKLRETLSSFYN